MVGWFRVGLGVCGWVVGCWVLGLVGGWVVCWVVDCFGGSVLGCRALGVGLGGWVGFTYRFSVFLVFDVLSFQLLVFSFY